MHTKRWDLTACRNVNQSGIRLKNMALALLAFVLIVGSPRLITPAVAQSKDTDESNRWLITGRTMGPVPFSVVIAYPPTTLKRLDAESAIESSLDRVNRLMSTYREDSDISRFNKSQSTDWFDVDVETAQVVHRAIEIHDSFEGSFDIRVASAVERWNFGPGKTEFELPTDDEINKLTRLLLKAELDARLDPPAIRKTDPQLKIDLSAIAKGYAVDRVSEQLAKLKCEDFMVEVGGEVYAMGYRDEDRQPWRLGIERPTKGKREIQAKVPLHDQAMATSGDYRNFFTHEGRRYSHTLDPTTCRPVEHFLASATVIADDCMTADALATAVMVIGAEKGHQLADELDFQLLTIDREEGFDGNLVVESTANFPLIDEISKDKSPERSVSSSGSASIWPTFIAALLVFSIAITGMAVGAIFANKPVTGSCGGLSAMAGNGEDGKEGVCGVCSKPATDCVEQPASETTDAV